MPNNLISASPRIRPTTVISVAATAAVAAIFVAFGFIQWPGLHWDASLFATPVINVATGKGWFFGGYPAALVAKTSQAYSGHGQFHVLVFGSWLRCDTWEKFLLWCGVVNAATFVAWTFLFNRTLRLMGRRDTFRSLLFGLMAGVIALGLQGRPEHLAPLLISLPLILRAFGLPMRLFQMFTYALSGLLLTLSPAVGLLFGMGLVFWLSLKYEKENNRTLWREYFTATCVAAITTVLVISIGCRIPVLEWAAGIVSSSGSALDFSDHLFRFTLSGITGTSLNAPLWNICVLAVAVLVVLILLRRRKFVGLCIVLALMLYCQPRLTDYGYVSFFPCVILFLIGKAPSSGLAFANPEAKGRLLFITTAVALPYSLGFARSTALAYLQARNGPSMAETRAQLRRLGAEAWLDQPVAAVFHGPSFPSFIVFGDASERFVMGTAGAIRRSSLTPKNSTAASIILFTPRLIVAKRRRKSQPARSAANSSIMGGKTTIPGSLGWIWADQCPAANLRYIAESSR